MRSGSSMNKAREYLDEKVFVEAFCAYPEAFINAAAAEGISLFSAAARGDNKLSFQIFSSQLPMIKRLAQSAAAELCVKEPGRMRRRRIKSRYTLAVFAGVFLLMLSISSLFIWNIEIHGLEKMSRGELLCVLEDSGVSIGRFWPSIKADEVRSLAMEKLPDIGWMTVNISGSRAMVLVRERVDKPVIYDGAEPQHLVACKSGIIRRVSALEGKTMVLPGQAVTEGELLVSAAIDSLSGEQKLVCSRGSVMAETWHELQALCPDNGEIKENKNKLYSRYALVLGKRRINFYISSGKAIDECDKITSEYTLGLEGLFALPVRVVREEIVRYESVRGNFADSEAMGVSLLNRLETGLEGQILSSSLSESLSGELYVLSLRAHCIENIARPLPVAE